MLKEEIMDKKLAKKIWKTFTSHPSMMIQPKGRDPLKPAIKVRNFLGSVDGYGEKFIKAMENFDVK